MVQPKLSAIEGVQRAEILGGRTFAMRVWLAGPDGGAGIAPPRCGTRWRRTTISTLGRTKGGMVSVNLVANTDLQTPEEFRRLVVKEHHGDVVRLGDIADVAGAENTTRTCGSTGRARRSWGSGFFQREHAQGDLRVREAMPDLRAQLRPSAEGGDPLRLHRVHRERDPRGAEDPHGETL